MIYSVKNQYSNKQNGYTILELLFYISFLITFSLIVISAIIVMTKSFRETAIYAEFMQGGTIMERISREIRQAYGINIISPDNLKLDTKDEEGANKTVSFFINSNNLEFSENDILTGNLNTPNIAVTGLTFTQITTTKGKAIKVTLAIRSNNDASARVQDFYDTVVLRGSY